MTYSNKILKEFILSELSETDNIYDILDKCQNQSEKGFVYEQLWNLCIMFNCFDKFPLSEYDIIIGNSNKGKPKIISSFQKYFSKNLVISGNSSGCSDITLRNKSSGKYIFITCKYPKNDKEAKDIKYYDIQMIVTIASDNKAIYKDYDIYTLVNNKQIVLDKAKRSKNDSIAKYLTDDKIFDESDLCLAFNKLHKFINTYDFDEFDNILSSNKRWLSHPFHQQLIITKTCQMIEEGSKTILWGCKPRSGKTYMAGGFIVNQMKNKYNVLIITPAPTETSPQFTEELFEKYYDFDSFKIVHLQSSKDIKKMVLDDNKNIIVISKQLLQMYIGENKINFGKINTIIFDENHFGGTSDLSEEIIQTYSNKNTIKIFLTATYNKPLQKWNIKENERIFWDIEDERFCKLNDWNSLIEKHGECVNIVCDHMINLGWNKDDILKEYLKYPELDIITTLFDPTRYETIKESIMESKYGFSMDILFSIKNKKFQYPDEVKQIMRYISGSHKETDFKFGDKSMFTRIKNRCSRHPFTQLWFLPVNGINDISKNLKEIMMADKILSKYDIFIVNSKSDEYINDIKGEINKREIKANDEGKSGLIILAGNMLTLGITLPLCDVVFMLNDTLSSDKVMQMMYRCMTEGENKKCGIVVDMNISRVLQACISYNIHKQICNTEEKIKYLIENHLINIDADLMNSNKIDTEKIISKLLEVWKSDPINNLTILLRQIENEIINIDNEDQQALNKYFTESINGKVKVEIQLNENDQKIQNGKEKTKIVDENKVIEEKPIKKISLTKDVLPFAIPLACILTLKDDNNDFIKMLDTIGNNNELIEVFNDQSFIWWNNKDIIKMIRDMTDKYIDKKSNTFNIAIIIKMTLKSLIDKPAELLEFIADRLKPKDVEKKKFGEVFTPMKLVNEMLDKLDESYKKDNNESIFENEKLTWFDPAVGMGNFPIAIYLRLMNGLSTKIPNEKKRKRHILEKMIYMAELNKKNVLICKQIFDIENKFKLNIYEGDSLKLDIQKVFNKNKFDVIVGNPPYNANGDKASGNTIWQHFVTKSIEEFNEYICFVHPNGWRKPNTEKGKFYGLFDKLTKENTMMYLEIHDVKDGMKQFKCGTRYDWYVIKNKPNKKYKTIIIDQEEKNHKINLNKYKWLANCELGLIDKLIETNNEKRCEILYSRNNYGADKKWISKEQTKEFKYPVVHSTPKDGTRYVWSNRNDNGFYGIPKVIFGDSGIYNPIIDINGDYAMTQHSMALKIYTKEEGEYLAKVLCSNIFNKIIKACLWSSYAIEWSMFRDFKHNFYELIDNEHDDNESKKKIIKKDVDDDSKKKIIKKNNC